MPRYIQFYRDAACTDLWLSVPVVQLSYTSVDSAPSTVTISGKQYKRFDGYGYRIRRVSGIQQSTPFISSLNTFPADTTLYCKNGFSLTVRIDNDYGSSHEQYLALKNMRAGGVTLSSDKTRPDESPVKTYLASIIYQGSEYIGFTQLSTETPDTVIPTMFMEGAFWQEAYRPAYDYGGKDDIDGGQGTGKYLHTGVSDSTKPTGVMPTGGRGLHYYKIDGPAYGSLQGYLWGDASTIGKSLWQKFINRTHTPISCVVGCFALPELFAPAGSGSDPIQIAGVRLSPISGSCMGFSPGVAEAEFSFPAQAGAYQCFADYSHTSCRVYVPYCGMIPVPMELALDRVIRIRYRVDQANGNLCAVVWSGDCVVGELSGNCAYQIPVIGGDTGALDKLGATLTGIIQITAGDYKGALQSGAEALSAPHTTQIVNGDLSGAAGYCSLRRPYIEYTRNGNTYTPGYMRTVGAPARIAGTLSDFTGGYGEFDSQISSADIPGATDREIDEITTLLRGGVFV